MKKRTQFLLSAAFFAAMMTGAQGVYAENANPDVNKPYWDRSLGRFLLNGGVAYEKGKWSTALNFTYLANRVMCPSTVHSYDQKPYLLTTFTAKYAPNAVSDITLTIDNVLSRQDIASHTSSDYYATPFNYLISYGYRF